MSELRLALLGQVAICKDGNPVTGFKSNKSVATLCYLAVTGQPVARTTLVGLLWSELGEANALMNLRHVLANLRELVGEHLAITRQTVTFQRECAYWLDVEPFESGVKRGTPEALRAALALYQGDFLLGLELRQAPLFEEWLNHQRLRLRTLAVSALQSLADQATQRDDPKQTIQYLRQLLTLEPWHEESHRQLMQLLARSGQVNGALAHYESCRQILAEELAVEPAAETTALYERLRLASQTPSYRLPASTTLFVGRTTEMALITRQLSDPACRCLTLVGPGGMGKTRLALEVAAALQPNFLQGVAFVSFAAVSTPELMVSTMAAALQLPLYSQSEPMQQLVHYLQDRELLLLLDNLEHLVAGGTLLAEILTRAPHIKLLCTSRQRLHLQSEWVIELGGLTFPTDRLNSPDRDEQSLQEYSAVQLFVQSAQRIHAHFVITPNNADAILHICRAVDGMPLGIELAAGWVRTLSCSEIAKELERSLALLTTTQPDRPERHQSIRAVFAHSWRLLSASQQELLSQLATFRRGFRWEAAQTVCAASLFDLMALVEKSLLKRDEQQERFFHHELMRQFAAEQQATHLKEETQEVEQRHSHYYLSWLTTHTKALQSAEPQLAVQAILPEIDNVRQAWRWAFLFGRWEWLGKALLAWRNFYHLRGLYCEASQWLQEALNHFSIEDDELFANPMLVTVKGHLLLYAAEIYIQQGHHAPALQHAQAADKLATHYRDLAIKGQAQALLGLIRCRQKSLGKALLHQQRALPLLKQAGDCRLYAHLLVQMGKSYEQMHQWEKAHQFQEEALQLFETVDDGWGCAIVWGALGEVNYGAGNLDKALACMQHALTRAQAFEAPAEMIHYTAEIGRIYWRTDRFAEALDQLHQAIDLATDVGLGYRVSDYHRLLGQIYKKVGQFNQAHNHLQQALCLAQRTNSPDEQIGALRSLSLLAEEEGKTQSALDYSQRALQVAERIGDTHGLMICLGRVGQLQMKLGQLALAHRTLAAAVSLKQEHEIRQNEPIVPHNLSRLANVLYQQGEFASAEATCRRCLRLLDAHSQGMFQSHEIKIETVLTLAQSCAAQGQPEEGVRLLRSLLATTTQQAQQTKIYALLTHFEEKKSGHS